MMENCVDSKMLNPYRELIVIKEPGSARHPNGDALKKIEMTRENAEELYDQLGAFLNKK